MLSLLLTTLSLTPCNFISKCGAVPCQCTGPTGAVRLILPPALYVPAAGSATIYGDAMMLVTTPSSVDILAVGPNVTAGTASLTISAPVASQQMTLFARLNGETAPAACAVEPVTATLGARTVLAVGDSLTAGGDWVDAVETAAGDVVDWVGTVTSAGGNKHEGISGKTWSWFLTHVDSPMTSAADTLDLDSYITAAGGEPDIIIWALGTNDVFSLATATLDTSIGTVLGYADLLMTAWDTSAPGVRHVVLMLPPGNALQAAFEDDYDPPLDSRTDWQLRRQRYNELLVAHYCGTDVVVLGSGLYVDSDADYPADNALHPDASGYQNIADAVWGWLAGQ